jgi:hypothetical protein
MFQLDRAEIRVALIEAHEACRDVPFWDVLQASERAALFYGQLRRAGVSRAEAELTALRQFAVELLTGDEESGIRLALRAYSEPAPELAL